MPTIETPKEFPIQPETYENLHDMTLWEIDTEIKKQILDEFLKVFSFLEPLCKNADECFKVTEAKRKENIDRLRYHGSIPEVILTVGAAFAPTTNLVPCGDELLGKYMKDADQFATLLKKDSIDFSLKCYEREENFLLLFICRQLDAICPPESDKNFGEAFRLLFAWGLFLNDLRVTQNPGKYPKERSAFMDYLAKKRGKR